MDRENNKTNVGTDVHIRNINLQTTGAVLHMEMWTGQMGRLYISKCGLTNLEGQKETGTTDCLYVLIWSYDICVILGRRSSRVYNVVTVHCITSIIPNIQ